MKAPRFPLVRDAPYDERPSALHCSIRVTWAEGEPPQEFCGDNWCTGTCGQPALVIPAEPFEGQERFWKASGSQVACGPLMQWKRVNWTGERVEVPREHREDFAKRMWV